MQTLFALRRNRKKLFEQIFPAELYLVDYRVEQSDMVVTLLFEDPNTTDGIYGRLEVKNPVVQEGDEVVLMTFDGELHHGANPFDPAKLKTMGTKVIQYHLIDMGTLGHVVTQQDFGGAIDIEYLRACLKPEDNDADALSE